MSKEKRLSPVTVAPVEAMIMEINPPIRAVDPINGTVDTVIAGYVDESDDEYRVIPFGKVSVVPSTSVINDSDGNKLKSAPASRVDGIVGETSVFSQVSEIGYYDEDWEELELYSADEIAANTKIFQKEAARVVFAHLGINPTPKKRPRKGLLRILRKS